MKKTARLVMYDWTIRLLVWTGITLATPIMRIAEVSAEVDTKGVFRFTVASATRNSESDIITLRDGRLLLAANGEPRASIVIADEPLETVCTVASPIRTPQTAMRAAEELQRYVERASGATLPIVKASEAPEKGTLILVGRSVLSKAIGLETPTESEGLLIKSFPRGIAILGEVAPVGTNNEEHEVDRGTFNAVYIFLEKFLGYRFFFQHERDPKINGLGITVPDLPTITITTPVELRDAPAFSQRVPVFYWRWQPATLAGRGNRFICGHSQQNWQRYFKMSHPEYFRLKKDGTRDFHQLCYSEPGVLKQYLEFWEEYYNTGMWRGDWLPPQAKYVYLEPSDNYGDCHCKPCQGKMRAEEDTLGRHSDLWWDFVCKAALEVKERRPGVRVAALAYARHYRTPNMDLPGNVDVMVATHWPRQYVGKQPGNHQKNMDMMKAWSAKVDGDRNRLRVFDYYCFQDNGSGAPIWFPRYKQRWLRETRAIMSGEYICGGGNNLARDLFMSKIWARLLWNPDLDINAYVAEYCKDFFGPAAEPMEALHRLLMDRYETIVLRSLREHVFTPHHIYRQIYPPTVVEQFERNLILARRAVAAEHSRDFDVMEDSAWLLRNESGEIRNYPVMLAPSGDPLTDPAIAWEGERLTYRGTLYRGQKLVVAPGVEAKLVPVAVKDPPELIPEQYRIPADKPREFPQEYVVYTAWLGTEVYPGQKYRVTFRGKATEGGNSQAAVGWSNGQHTIFLTQTFDDKLRTVSHVVTVPQGVDRIKQLCLYRFKNTGRVWYSGLSLKRVFTQSNEELPSAGMDVTDRIEGKLPSLGPGSSKVFQFFCGRTLPGSRARLTMGEPVEAGGRKGLFRRRVVWQARGFELFHPTRTLYDEEGQSGFLAIARTVEGWLDYVPTYNVGTVDETPPNDLHAPAWQQAEPTYLVRGRPGGMIAIDSVGFPADVPTSVRMVRDADGLHIAFYCTQLETPGEGDSVGVTLYPRKNESLRVTCRPDGALDVGGNVKAPEGFTAEDLKAQAAAGISRRTEGTEGKAVKAEGLKAAVGSGDRWWGVFLTIPLKTIAPGGKPSTIHAQFERIRGSKSYVWSPSLRPAWGPAQTGRHGRIVFPHE